jgi:hypothetical protein
MNLQENIQRIKEVMGISESEREIFDFSDLVNKGVLWVTEPHVNGELVPANWEGDSNIVTLWNLKNPEQGQEWVYDAIKHPKSEAIQYWTNEGQFNLSQEKYEQILRSIKMLNRKNVEEKESGEKWVKCFNCKKKFTQTIYKGKKSLPICPNCGTHNSFLKESIIPISIIRRANEEVLKKYISLGELNYPTLCDDFNDEYEYSDHVIDYAIDEFLSENTIDIEDEDYYSDVMDYLSSLCRDIFGEYLYEVYKNTCSEYNLFKENLSDEFDSDSKKIEQNEGELTEKCWKGYTQKGMKTMFGKRYPNCVKKKKK